MIQTNFLFLKHFYLQVLKALIILSYDVVTGFLVYQIDNRAIQAVVTPGQQYMNVLLHGAYVAMQCKKIHTLLPGGQGRVASGRVVPARGLHRHQSLLAVQERGQVLQWSRHGRAMDQGRQECGTVDQALLPQVQRQSDAVAVVCLGLQPGKLPAAAGPAESGPTLVADDAAGQADQDRGQGNEALEVHHVPTGRSGRDANLIRGHSQPDRAVGDPAAGSRVRNAGLGTG